MSTEAYHYETATHYDADLCLWVDEVQLPQQAPVRGLEAILRKAEEMGVSDREACSCRVDFIKQQLHELEKIMWVVEKQSRPDNYEARLNWIASLPPEKSKRLKPPDIRLGVGPNGYHTDGEIQRALEEHTLLSKYETAARERTRMQMELHAIESYLKGGRIAGSVNALSDFDIHSAYQVDVRKVLDVEGIPYAKNGLLCCPIHKEKNPSASVAKGFLKCFSMGCRPPVDGKTGKQKEFFGAVELFQFFYGGSKIDAIRGVLAL